MLERLIGTFPARILPRRSVPDQDQRAVLEAAYLRLLTAIDAKDVRGEGLRLAALEALAQAREQLELNADWKPQTSAPLPPDTPDDS